MEEVTDPAVHRRRRLVAGGLAAALALASATAGALTGAGGMPNGLSSRLPMPLKRSTIGFVAM